jgi:hypothetical protein
VTIDVQGMLRFTLLIVIDSKGNLYIAATGTGIQKLAFKGMSTAAAR